MRLDLILLPLAALLFGVVSRKRIELALGRFFRDVARSKARKRLYGNEHALMTMIRGLDEPIIKPEDETDETVTPEELASANGLGGAPTWLAIRGRVYDVSAAPQFYGPGKSYHKLVARDDATRAFGLGCTATKCLGSSVDDLDEKQLKEIDRWIELYDSHDKYTYVGKLLDSSPVDDALKNYENNGEE
mmetsp:Transcript_32727/g.104319  ORF Transcript_32727/g.104319 Transcript_32727/m.104319 type:complete len:189 (-) Transcript_32727:139-705(-)